MASSTRCSSIQCVQCFACILACVVHAQGLDGSAEQADRSLEVAKELVLQNQFEQAVLMLNDVAPVYRSYEFHHLMGLAKHRLGESAGARRHLQEALRIRPTSRDDLILLAEVLIDGEKFSLAIEALESAQRLGSKDAHLHLNLARAYHRIGVDLGELEVRLLPEGRVGRLHQGYYLIEPVARRLGEFLVAPKRSAIYHLQKARDAGLQSLPLRILEGDIWLTAHRYGQAVAVYAVLQDEVQERMEGSEGAGFQSRFADACLHVDDVEGYVAHMEKAVASDKNAFGPVMCAVYQTAARHCSADGDLSGYLRHLKSALAYEPADADLHYKYGNALLEAGRNEDAIHQWRITMELDPDHADRTRMLERIRSASPRSLLRPS